MADDEDNGDDSATDLLIHTFEISLRTSIRMMKVPLVMYAGMIDNWAKVVDSMVEDLQSRY